MELRNHVQNSSGIGRLLSQSIRAAVIVIIAGQFLQGCASDMVSDPPQLELITGSGNLPPPRITEVTVKNDAGKVILGGKPDDQGFIAANPDRAKLDGTLHITSRWSDGYIQNQTLKHEPGKPVKITFDRDVREFKLEEPELKSEERRPGLFETLAPALIPSIGIGGGRHERIERRH
jgi:hypothetical protein